VGEGRSLGAVLARQPPELPGSALPCTSPLEVEVKSRLLSQAGRSSRSHWPFLGFVAVGELVNAAVRGSVPEQS